MPIAYPVGSAKLEDLRARTFVHITKAAHRDGIITGTDPAGLPAGANCRVHLKAGQGWSVAPFRLLRDYSVLDPYLHNLKNYGRYTYFFVGAPGRWALTKNIGGGLTWGSMGDDFLILSVRGEDVLACTDLLFYRPDDNVVVIRGDYSGPACADPAP